MPSRKHLPKKQKRNPSKVKKAARSTGRALKGAARGILSTGAGLLESGAAALNPTLPYWNVYFVDSNRNQKWFVTSSPFGVSKADALARVRRSHYPGKLKAGQKLIAEKAVIEDTRKPNSRRRKNKTIIKARKVTVVAPNPRKRLKVRNKYIDLVIKGTAKKTPQGWRIGGKNYAQGKRTVKLASGYYLDKASGYVYAKRERNIAGYKDESGQFHPIRSGMEATGKGLRKSKKPYRPSAVGEKATYSPRKATKRALQSKRLKSAVKSRKATASRLAGRSLKRSAGMLKKRNPSPDAIRKDFAGRVGKGAELYFPEGTPTGLAKLGKLVSITTEEGTLKPTNGTAWLCADTKGKLHIGATANKPLWSGDAHSFGSVRQVEYLEAKPHLGFPNPIVFYHKLGEENGVKPNLYADGKGGLKFRGGAYRITREGIVN